MNLPFKIDCDSLTDEDISCLAKLARRIVTPSQAIPVPTGGNRLAAQLELATLTGYPVIVDDVWTTGGSVLKIAAEHDLLHKLGTHAYCLVIFSRGSHPHWVKPIFTLNPVLQTQNFLWK